MFVDDELPKACGGACGAKVLEVKGQHRQPVTFSYGHDGSICVPELEVSKRGVQLNCPAK